MDDENVDEESTRAMEDSVHKRQVTFKPSPG